MLVSLNNIFKNDQSYIKQNQLSQKDIQNIKKIVPELNIDYVIAYKSVGNFLLNKTYIFTCNAVYVNKNLKITFIGLLDILKKGNQYTFVYVDRKINHNIDQEVYDYINKILNVKKSFIKKADDLVYGDHKNLKQALEYYKETIQYDDFNQYDKNPINITGYYYWERKYYIHALAYYLIGEKLQDWMACFNMGLMYQYGYDVEKDLDVALSYYNKAQKIDPKNKTIHIQLGWLYKERKDYKGMYTKFMAYGGNNAEIENQLGLAYWHGWGVRKDLKSAYNYLKSALEKDSRYCYNMAVYCNDAGYKSSFYSYAKMADKINHIKADTLLGAAFKDGIGVEVNNKRAETYLKRAVSIDEKDLSALYNLGDFYRVNLKDYESAFECFKKAADQNHVNSCISLMKMYINGEYVEKDREIAKQYLKKASDNYDKDGRLLLAQMYIDGDAVKKEDAYAEHLIMEAIKEDQTNDSLLFYFEKLLKKELKVINADVSFLQTTLMIIYDNEYRISKDEYKELLEIFGTELNSRIVENMNEAFKDLQS